MARRHPPDRPGRRPPRADADLCLLHPLGGDAGRPPAPPPRPLPDDPLAHTPRRRTAGPRRTGQAPPERVRRRRPRPPAAARRGLLELWRLQATQELRAQQRPLLDALAEQTQGRVEVGRGALANLAQLNLARARLDDTLTSLQSARRSAEARLLGLVGAAPSSLRETPIHPRSLAITLPAAPPEQLADDAAAHPRVARFQHLASRSAAAERGALARRYPSLMVGLDWIETGEADPGLSHTGQAPADSGKDPVIAMLSLSLPIWADSYSDEAEAARREQDAAHERQLSATDRARGELYGTLEALRDTARRARLFDDGLLPQADLTFQTVTGAWSASQAPLSDVLLALRDLIDLRVERATLQAEHLKLWARLEFIVGHPLDRQEAP